MAQSLRFLPVSLFSAVMGLAGLGLACRSASALLAARSPLAEIWIALAVIALLFLVPAYLTKASRYPQAVREEFTNPALLYVNGSALDAAEAALRALDLGPIAARRIVQRFRRHDEEALAEQARHRGDVGKLISMTQQGRRDLEKLLTSEATRS